MIIGIITNIEKDKKLKYTNVLVQSIKKRNCDFRLLKYAAQKLCMPEKGLDENELYEVCNIVICLGGDGTFINVARNSYGKEMPILGVNLGSLGFLTEVDKHEIDSAVDHVISGKYNIEERMLLSAKIIRNGEIIAQDFALNDIVVSRKALRRILRINTYVNDAYIDSFPGDGIIVSSPTGSTAYSLSAGGPIVEPDIDLMILTPICPHILYSRSFITPGDRVVKIKVEEEYSDMDASVTIDGQHGYDVGGGDIIEVRKGDKTIKMITINSRNFFNVLRAKIYNRGENGS